MKSHHDVRLFLQQCTYPCSERIRLLYLQRCEPFSLTCRPIWARWTLGPPVSDKGMVSLKAEDLNPLWTRARLVGLRKTCFSYLPFLWSLSLTLLGLNLGRSLRRGDTDSYWRPGAAVVVWTANRQIQVATDVRVGLAQRNLDWVIWVEHVVREGL